MAEAAAEITPDDLNCPVCDYSLRGLPEPRCPECGYAFEWEELRQRAENRRKWFYEHAETFKSHLKTRWRSLRPWSFWRDIQAYTFANPRRLARYQWVTLAMVLVASTVMALPMVLGEIARQLPNPNRIRTATTLPTSGYYQLLQTQPVYTFVTVGPPSTGPARRRRVAPTTPQPTLGALSAAPPPQPGTMFQPVPVSPPQFSYTYVVLPNPWIGWIQRFAVRRSSATATSHALAGCGVAMSLALLALPRLYWRVLRLTVMRANIKAVHLTRVNAYTVDAVPWLMVVAGLAEVGWTAVFGMPYWTSGDFTFAVLHAMLIPSILVTGVTLRLASALRRYVRFPHAWPVALAFGLMALLAWLTVAVQWSVQKI